jgi:SAM-dependent methyltransferase
VRLDDPEVVAAEYADERGLEARRAAYRNADGPDARELVFDAVAAGAPRRLLEVGCGPGELAERVRDELGADVVAIDISPRMVELARGRGIDAQVGDVQELPFAGGEFDCAVAAWMLYHVPDVDRALAELRRVLRPGGRLVVSTNCADHLRELCELVGVARPALSFGGENGRELLERHFARVTVRDAPGSVRFPDHASAVAYVEGSRQLFGAAAVPPFDGELVVRRHPVVFVAETAA